MPSFAADAAADDKDDDEGCLIVSDSDEPDGELAEIWGDNAVWVRLGWGQLVFVS